MSTRTTQHAGVLAYSMLRIMSRTTDEMGQIWDQSLLQDSEPGA